MVFELQLLNSKSRVGNAWYHFLDWYVSSNWWVAMMLGVEWLSTLSPSNVGFLTAMHEFYIGRETRHTKGVKSCSMKIIKKLRKMLQKLAQWVVALLCARQLDRPVECIDYKVLKWSLIFLPMVLEACLLPDILIIKIHWSRSAVGEC